MPGKTHHMPHINLGNDLPGIRGLMAFRPETARPLNELAEQLLGDDDNTLSRGERELIGAYVSYLNDCFFCQNVHGAMAGHYLACDVQQIDSIKHDFKSAELSDKMKALLSIAASVQKGGKQVTELQIDEARKNGATDVEIHDTVLIAAAFCMFNRYVDGLATTQPRDEAMYRERGKWIARDGYVSVSKEYLPAEAAR